MSIAPLPDGAILLHVGPHKTGTTAIQFAASTRRVQLAASGITFPGTGTHHSPAAMSVGERGWGWEGRGGVEVHAEQWGELLEEVERAPDKVFITSEFFGELAPRHIERAVTDLGRDRIHVVVTLRPLTKILPSSWQQYLKYGNTREYVPWLEGVLADPPDPNVTPSFWARQDHGALVERWVAELGPDRVTVIVLDEQDHGMLPAAFEQLLGLDPGTLAPAPGQRSNRSMTAAECEIVRRTNQHVGRALNWPDYERIVRNGAILRMVENRTPDRDEPRITLPHWAAVRANELGTKAAARITATNARVVGDLARLAPVPQSAGAPETESETAPIDVAVEAVVGAISGALHAGPFLDRELLRQRRDLPAPEDRRFLEDLRVHELTTTELTELLRVRVREGVKRRIKLR